MNAIALERAVLILSPSPPLPRDYGNRNRVNQLFRFFSERGYKTYFLLYPFDKDWETGIPDYRQDLNGQCTYFETIPNTKPLHRPATGTHHAIDEWWDDSIEWHIRWLTARVKFDVVLVNYIFFSKAFDIVPPSVFKVLDTHDLFSGRRELFERQGLDPEFFYTTKDVETRAFERADLIISIKDLEDDIIRSMTDRRTICIPYWNAPETAPARAIGSPVRFTHDRPLRVGFVGAENSVNIVNLRAFMAQFRHYDLLYNPPIELHVAGNVCKGLGTVPDWVKTRGHVENLSDFYADIDITIAPLDFSTGIKIKVGESLSIGVPVVATENGFDGFSAFHPSQSLTDQAAVCRAIVKIAFGEIDVPTLVAAARHAAEAAARRSATGLRQLNDVLHHSIARLVVITDCAFWSRESLAAEMQAQAIDLLGDIAPTIALYVGTGCLPAATRINNVEVLQVDDAAAGLAAIATAFRLAGLIDLTSVQTSAETLLAPYRDSTLVGTLKLAPDAGTAFGHLQMTTADRVIPAASFRYLPDRLGSAVAKTQGSSLVVFHNEELSVWDEIMLDHLGAVAASAGLTLSMVECPNDALSSASFYAKLNDLIRSRTIFLGERCDTFLVLRQLVDQARGRWLVLREGFMFPPIQSSDGFASLNDTVDAFLDGSFWPRQMPIWPHAGWDDIWRVYADAVRQEHASQP